MCLLGARNKTELQLKKLLNYDLLPKDFNTNDANAQLFNYLNLFKEVNLTLNIANKIYTKQGIAVKKEFLNNMQSIFLSYLHPIDFSNPMFAANLINSWIAVQTNNKIQNLLTSDMMDANTMMILINAIYFKGNWMYSFDRNLTKKERFYLEDGSHKKVKMMHLPNGYLKLRRNPLGLNASICEFPYISNSMSMSVILPDENIKLSEIEKALDYEKFEIIMEQEAVRTLVDVSFPKFKLEEEFEVKLDKIFLFFMLYQYYIIYFKLSEVLSNMGAVDPFRMTSANFSGISDTEKVFIDKIVHKSFVELGEDGTEATSATSILSTNRHIDIPVVFKCNKPFIFLIHENQNNTILFIGKYLK